METGCCIMTMLLFMQSY